MLDFTEAAAVEKIMAKNAHFLHGRRLVVKYKENRNNKGRCSFTVIILPVHSFITLLYYFEYFRFSVDGLLKLNRYILEI